MESIVYGWFLERKDESPRTTYKTIDSAIRRDERKPKPVRYRKISLDRGGPLMEAATVRERLVIRTMV